MPSFGCSATPSPLQRRHHNTHFTRHPLHTRRRQTTSLPRHQPTPPTPSMCLHSPGRASKPPGCPVGSRRRSSSSRSVRRTSSNINCADDCGSAAPAAPRDSALREGEAVHPAGAEHARQRQGLGQLRQHVHRTLGWFSCCCERRAVECCMCPAAVRGQQTDNRRRSLERQYWGSSASVARSR